MTSHSGIEPVDIGRILVIDQRRDVIDQRRMVQRLLDAFRHSPDAITARWLDLEHEDLLMQEQFLAHLEERYGEPTRADKEFFRAHHADKGRPRP